jgi:hypothetical protein
MSTVTYFMSTEAPWRLSEEPRNQATFGKPRAHQCNEKPYRAIPLHTTNDQLTNIHRSLGLTVAAKGI